MTPRSSTARWLAALRGGCAMAVVLGAVNSIRSNDILRPTVSDSSATTRGSSSTSTSTGSGTQTPGSISAAALLQRTSAAMAAVAAMQAAARAAATSSTAPNNLGVNPNSTTSQTLPDVPDGLITNSSGPGLQVAVNSNGTPVEWVGANAPVVGSNPDQVTITQTQQQALLKWTTFDIGRNTTLTFDQSAGAGSVGDWIAFNYVTDPSGRPSQILGTLRTTNGVTDSNGTMEVGGQVYVLNQNGIIFGGSSQIDVHTLVASSLPINPNLVSGGLLNDTTNYQFLFSSSDITVTGQKTATGVDAFGDSSTSANYVAPPPANGYGAVTVQPGAEISSPASSTHVGGAVILVGPAVTNAGTISTPDGQTILAAGLQVGLTAHDNNDATRTGWEVVDGVLTHPSAGSSDPSLRGLDVYIGAVVEPGTNTTNSSGSNYAPLQYVTQADGSTTFASSAWNGVVTNGISGGTAGLIQAPEGNVTMAGAIVNQMGVIESSTSVSLNGRIDLLAGYNSVVLPGQLVGDAEYQPFSQQAAGLVNFGSSSITQIVTDSSGGTVVGTQLTLPSQIDVQAHAIHLEGDATGSSGAVIQATGGQVTMTAGDWLINPAVSGETALVQDTGQIYVDAGAAIDVSGSQNVTASVADNIVAVQLRGTELADSPVQQGGPLVDQTIDIDIRDTGTYDGTPWVGTPLAITTGYVNLIERSIGELTIGGGAVSLNAGGSVVLQPGSSINVSSGWINYQAAYVQTTKLLGANGQIYDISQALPDIKYEGIYTGTTTTTDSKWGISQTSTNPIALGYEEAGYVQGGSGGSINISAPSITPEATLMGYTVAGAQQINAPNAASLAAAVAAGIDPNIWELSTVPTASRLSLLFQGQEVSSATNLVATVAPAPPNITIASSASLPVTTGFDPNSSDAPGAAGASVVISPSFLNLQSSTATTAVSGGFGTLNIADSDGTITLPKTTDLTLPNGGSLTFTAASIDLEGDISAPGGSLNFISYDFSPYSIGTGVTGTTPAYDDTRGSFTLGASATLDVAGTVVDLRTAAGAVTHHYSNGGSVVIKANDVDLEKGSSIDVSGGVVVSTGSTPTYGSAGSIVIDAGEDPFTGTLVINSDGTVNASALAATANDATLGGELVLDATLTGYSGTKGGSLSLEAPAIQIGGTDPNAVTDTDTLWLPATATTVPFFNQGGFASFSLTGIGMLSTSATGVVTNLPGITIESGSYIDPVVETWSANVASGVTLTPWTAPYGVRPVASLSFTAAGSRIASYFNPNSTDDLVVRGDLIMDAGSSIAVDPFASYSSPTPAASAEGAVSLKGDTVEVEGTVQAPGGTITVAGGSSYAQNGQSESAVPTVLLGAASELSTSGAAVMIDDNFGRSPGATGYVPTGSVLSGGSITVAGNIVAQPGSEIMANGATGSVVPPASYIAAVGEQGGLSSLSNLSLTQIDTNGGSITLAAGQELYSAAGLSALAGNSSDPKSSGGALTVYGGYFNPGADNPIQVATDVTLNVTTAPVAFTYTGGPSAGGAVMVGGVAPAPVDAADGHVTQAQSSIDAKSINAGGFASVLLQGPSATEGAVNLEGSFTLTASGSIVVGNSGSLAGSGNVTLEAPYVALGQTFQPPALYTPQLTQYPQLLPTYGTGTLSVVATELIDVGNLSLQGIGTLSLNAGDGDIRGDGTLDVAGNILLTAGQIYPPTAVQFNIAAYPYLPSGATTAVGGTVTIASGGAAPQLPLSAGGVLSIYADTIVQGGTLVAPYGQINFGSATSVTDPVTGEAFPTTNSVTLRSGSLTSTSDTTNPLTDAATGAIDPIPYGFNVNGTEWIDPIGTNITVAGNGVLGAGLPNQEININSPGVSIQGASGTTAAATINVAGGGDLFAYQFVPGTGGTIDVLNSPTNKAATSFAIIPGYAAAFAPYAPYGTSNSAAAGDYGYANSAAVGTQIYLNAGSGVAAGVYTLLPARYALLPGAYLVTEESGVPTSAVTQSDGSTVVSGYVFNSLTGGQTGSAVLSSFDVAPTAVVQKRAEYTLYSANSYFASQATAQGTTVPRLPQDSGLVAIAASTGLELQGTVDGTPVSGGRGSLVELSGPPDSPIEINATGTGTDSSTIYLNATELSGFGSEGLLIGGTLTSSSAGTSVDVTDNQITVDKGSDLTSTDLILVANDSLTINSGAILGTSGTRVSSIGALQIGEAATANSGDGVVLRLSTDPNAAVTRQGVSSFSPSTLAADEPALSIGSGAQLLAGTGSVTLNSTGAASIDSTAGTLIDAATVNLGSGQIALQLGTGATPPSGTTALVLSGSALQTLLGSATAVSLLSYSSIDTYGAGTFGALTATGTPLLTSLQLHTGELRGFGAGSGVVFNAQTVTLDNSPGVTGPGPDASVPTPTGSLTFNGTTIVLGATATEASQNNNLAIDQFASVTLAGSTGISILGSGGSNAGLTAAGSLTLATPLVYTALSANQTLAAGGALAVQPSSGTAAATAPTAGIGGAVALVGTSVSVAAATEISAPSGAITLHATDGDVTVAGTLSAAGTTQKLTDSTEYTPGGAITLTSDTGNVAVSTGGVVSVAAPAAGGNAGSLQVSAPLGGFSLAGSALGTAGAGGGQAGTAIIDVGNLLDATGATTTALDPLETALDTGGFVQSQSIRVRNGDVALAGTATAWDFDLSADQGDIDIAGTVNASGNTGGSISLAASGSVNLESGGVLNAQGENFNAAGHGGSVTVSAGTSVFDASGTYTPNTSAFVNLAAGSTVNLSVINNHPVQLDVAGTSSVAVPAGQEFYFPSGTPGDDEVTFESAGTITTSAGVAKTFAAGYTTTVPSGSTVVFSGSSAGTVLFAQGSGGSVPLSLPASVDLSAAASITDLTAFNFTGTLALRAPQVLNSHGLPTDVQIDPLNGTIENPSSIVVEGYQVFEPVGGDIGSIEGAVQDNGAAFAGGLNSAGVLEAGNTAAIVSRLTANWGTGAGQVNGSLSTSPDVLVHVQPAAEIVNVTPAGPIVVQDSSGNATTVATGSSTTVTSGSVFVAGNGTQLTLNTGGTVGSEIDVSSGSDLTFAQGTPAGDTVTLIGSGTITVPGNPNPVAFNATAQNPLETTLAAGAVVAFTSSGSLALYSGTSAVAVALSNGFYTTDGTGTTTVTDSSGNTQTYSAGDSFSGTSSITLNSPGAPGSGLALASGSALEFPSGTGGNAVNLTGSGKITTVAVPSQTLAAGSSFTAASGTVISLNTPGSTGSTASTGSTLTVPGGAVVSFPTASPTGDTLQFTSTSPITVTDASGNKSTFTPTTTNPSLTMSVTAGSTVAFSGSGSVSIASGPSAASLALSAGSYGTTGGTATLAAIASTSTAFTASSSDPYNATLAAGSVVTFSAVGGISLPSGSANVTVALPTGSYTTAGVGTSTLVNTSGQLVLNNTWDLSGYRFGPNATTTDPNTMVATAVLGAGEPGTLTLRSAGNIVFAYNASGSGAFASLSDGFGGPTNGVASASTLLNAPLLPVGSSSWSYQIVAGADFTAADFAQVQSLSALEASGGGSVILGGLNEVSPSQLTASADRDTVLPAYYQVIRTGTGSIDLVGGVDVQSLNTLATIYTAGQQAPALAGFDTPDIAYNSSPNLGPSEENVGTATNPNAVQYAFNGGNVALTAQRDIIQDDVVNGQVVLGSGEEMPTNWLYRQGYTDANGDFAVVPSGQSKTRTGYTNNQPGTAGIASTSWWVDYSNYFEGVGALGGGNVTLSAGRDVVNVDAVVPTNARMTGFDPTTGDALAASSATLLELGGGNLSVTAGNDISGGVYYVERGAGSLNAGSQILTNAARTVLNNESVMAFGAGTEPDPTTWLPTTLFVGDATFTVSAVGSIDLGPVVNPFLLPQGINNAFWNKTYFSTYAANAGVTVASLTGAVTLTDDAQYQGASLYNWYSNIDVYNTSTYSDSLAMPWLRLDEQSVTDFNTYLGNTNGVGVFGLMPANVSVTAVSGAINLVGNLTLAPAPTGNLVLAAYGSINGLQPNALSNPDAVFSTNGNPYGWYSASIDVSDADPARIPGPADPLTLGAAASGSVAVSFYSASPVTALDSINVLLNDSSFDESSNAPLQEKEALHDASVLHADDSSPLLIESSTGSVSGFTLFSPKETQVEAGKDITDIAFYIQNDNAGDVSVISAGQDLLAFDATAPLLEDAQFPTGTNLLYGGALSGNIQLGGPGTLELTTGRNLNLGVGTGFDGTGTGVLTVGNSANPFLPFTGADIVAAAGLNTVGDLSASTADFSSFITQFVDPSTAGAYAARYLPELAKQEGLTVATGETTAQVWSALLAPSAGLSAAAQTEAKDLIALNVFYLVLRDAGRDRNDATSPDYGKFTTGYAAVAALFPNSPVALNATTPNPYSGSISLATREIATTNGGDISLLAPGGSVTVGNPTDPQKVNQGILTEYGGNINIFAENDVNVGTSRIFTLQGGNEIIWSSIGNIAAGSGSKTVYSAPPTQVLVDPQSANVENDLQGLATGSGIGVLATLAGTAPSDVDLIAPIGTVDAGDAGIRASGNLNIAAAVVLNASNIQVSGTSAGLPPAAAAPNIAAISAASNASASATSAAEQVTNQQQQQATTPQEELPSIIDIDVLGYGGDDEELSDLPPKAGPDVSLL